MVIANPPFRPDMNLAKELLIHGKKNIVISFLNKYKKYWKDSTSLIKTYKEIPLGKWIHEIEQGKTPDFNRDLEDH